MGKQEFWMDGNRRAVMYDDGEIYVDGQKRGKLYSDGDVYIDGQKRGKLYTDGELYIDGNKVGKLYSDGEFWADGQRIGKVYKEEDSYGSSVTSAGLDVGGTAGGGAVVLLVGLIGLFLIGAIFFASYKSWVYMFWNNLQDYSDTPGRMVISGILIVVIQLAALVLQIRGIVSEKTGWGIGSGLMCHTVAAFIHMTLVLLILDGIPSDIWSMVLPIVFVCLVIALVPTTVGCLIGNVWRFINKKRRK